MLDPSKLGWYEIDEEWKLYDDGDLKNTVVTYINVQRHPERDEYKVTHYGIGGRYLITLTLTTSDLIPTLSDKDPISKPDDITP